MEKLTRGPNTMDCFCPIQILALINISMTNSAITKVILPNTMLLERKLMASANVLEKKLNGVLQKRWIYQDQYRLQ